MKSEQSTNSTTQIPTTLAEAFKIAKATRTKPKKVKRDTNN
jgi:hypothetical protein